MKLHVELSPNPACPAPLGAHALAWSYVLDYIFADSFHAGLSELQVVAPGRSLLPELDLRARLSAGAAASAGSAQALLGGGAPAAAAARVYRLRPGMLAPAAWRAQLYPPLAGRKPLGVMYVYTLRSKLLGLPMRLGNLLGAPFWADRSLAAVRRGFTSERPCWAFYQLETWE